jgi:hypothetical protein
MMLQRHKQENRPQESLLDRFKTRLLRKNGATKNKEKVHTGTSDLSEIGERSHAFSSSEAELKKYLGPVDKSLVENAKIAKRRKRMDDRRRSIQLNSSDPRSLDGGQRSKTLPRYFLSKRTPFNSVRCKWCEPIEQSSAVEHIYETGDETYIDENGIYTTVLCFSEI